MARLGLQQLRLLIMTASPTCLLLTTDKVSDSLVRSGLFIERYPATRAEKRGGACAITPAGLRALANEMDAGRVDKALDRMSKDRAAMDKKIAARRARIEENRKQKSLAKEKGLV